MFEQSRVFESIHPESRPEDRYFGPASEEYGHPSIIVPRASLSGIKTRLLKIETLHKGFIFQTMHEGDLRFSNLEVNSLIPPSCRFTKDSFIRLCPISAEPWNGEPEELSKNDARREKLWEVCRAAYVYEKTRLPENLSERSLYSIRLLVYAGKNWFPERFLHYTDQKPKEKRMIGSIGLPGSFQNTYEESLEREAEQEKIILDNHNFRIHMARALEYFGVSLKEMESEVYY